MAQLVLVITSAASIRLRLIKYSGSLAAHLLKTGLVARLLQSLEFASPCQCRAMQFFKLSGLG